MYTIIELCGTHSVTVKLAENSTFYFIIENTVEFLCRKFTTTNMFKMP